MILFIPSTVFSRDQLDTVFMNRMFRYAAEVNKGLKNLNGTQTNAYLKYRIKTDKRNFTLFCVPTMYAIARGNRDYLGEIYTTLKYKGHYEYEELDNINIGTIPHNQKTFPTLLHYLTPTLYENTLYKDQILSPFNDANHKFYKYKVTFLINGRAKVSYKPRIYNTQLVHGWALVDYWTGRVISAEMDGEYDMISFELNVEMGNDGYQSLMPIKSNIHAKFRFLGNKLQTWLTCYFRQPIKLPDKMSGSNNRTVLSILRPEPLSNAEKAIYHHYDSIKAVNDTINKKVPKHKSLYQKMWDNIGDNIVGRLGANFGDKNKASVRTSPLFNPLYMSYSPSRGITYRYDIDFQFDFTDNRYFAINPSTGYSFKLKQFFFEVPVTMVYNERRHAFVKFTIGNGNRISNSSILDEIKQEKPDTINFDKMHLDRFKDMYMKLENNFDISNYFTLNAGFVFHRRSAVDKIGFEQNGRPTVYKSFAPNIKVIYRPIGWNGPVITADYERCIDKMLGSDMKYEKYEFDAVMKKDFERMCVLSMRLGGGFYTNKSNKTYFLDYSNFRQNNLVGGWNDEWTGDFQLLNSDWYNASDYYVRGNFTYEKPLLIATWIPIIGHYIEKERLYVNALMVTHLHPYIEYGYGLTNRFFSIAAFIGTMNGKYDGFGCQFTFELFNKW